MVAVGDSNSRSERVVVCPVSDSTIEPIIERTVEGIQRMIKPYDGDDDDETTTDDTAEQDSRVF